MGLVMFIVFLLVGYVIGNLFGAFIALVIWIILAGFVLVGQKIVDAKKQLGEM